VEQALRHRRPAAVFIDEAQHLGRIASGRKLSDQLDVIKSIANRTGTVHVLFGTYELLAFRNLSGQLSRRTVDVHFARYSSEQKEDVQVFKNVLLTFQQQLPFPVVPDLADIWDLLYERTLGCVGILKDWLRRALAVVVADGGKRLTRKYLEETALSISQCEKIWAEMRDGEMRLADSEGARSRLRHGLGLESTPASVQTEQGVWKAEPQKMGARRVQRRPHRDRIGTGVTALVQANHL
jgi:hypothetical protein